jgi:transcriptional regulator with XRE-family HTH domain
MNLVDRIKGLCLKKGVSIARIEQDVGLANGSIRKWDRALPSADRLGKVADYFNVSIDWLLGRDISQDIKQPEKTDLKEWKWLIRIEELKKELAELEDDLI